MGRLTYSTMCKHSDCVPFFLFLYLLLFSSGLVNIIKFVRNEKFKKIVEFLHSFVLEHSWWLHEKMVFLYAF